MDKAKKKLYNGRVLVFLLVGTSRQKIVDAPFLNPQSLILHTVHMKTSLWLWHPFNGSCMLYPSSIFYQFEGFTPGSHCHVPNKNQFIIFDRRFIAKPRLTSMGSIHIVSQHGSTRASYLLLWCRTRPILAQFNQFALHSISSYPTLYLG